MVFKEFNYTALKEIIDDSEKLHAKLHFSTNFELFSKRVQVNHFTVPNSLAFHPMEGCDGKADGSPDELTIRCYERFAGGGAGLLWFEAVAVVREGRAYPRQLWIHEGNLQEFQKLFEKIMSIGYQEYGKDFTPLCIMQLTHSGKQGISWL